MSRRLSEPEIDAVFVYVRISVASDLATKRQEKRCRAEAAARGLTVAAVYTDDGVSAFSGAERAGFDRMIADATADAAIGRRVLIIAWDLDRLVRRVREVGRLLDLYEEHGVPFATVQGGVDLTSGAGKLIAYILTAVAEMESEHKAERMRLRFEQDRERGKAHWSFRPFGFAKVDGAWVHDPAEAATVRELYGRFNDGESIRSLAVWLQAEEITQPARLDRETGEMVGKPWTARALTKLLRSERNAGVYRSSIPELAEETFPADWEPIVTADVFARAARALATNTAARTVTAGRRHLLSGLLVCDHCGGLMAIAPKGAGYSNYKCRKDAAGGHGGCGRTVSKIHADAIVRDAVLSWLENPANREALKVPDDSDANAADLADVIAVATERRRHLVAMTDPDRGADAWTDEEIDPEMRKLAARIREATAALGKVKAASPAETIDPDALAESWERLSIEDQRALITDVLEPVRVRATAKAGCRFDSSRVLIVPRYGTVEAVA